MHLLILAGLGIFELLLALNIYSRYQKTLSIKALIGVLIGFSAMSLLLVVVGILNDSSPQRLAGSFAYYAGCFTFVSLLQLALHYPIPSSISKRFINALFWVPLVIFLPFVFTDKGFLVAIPTVDGLPKPETGVWSPLFTGFAVSYFIATIVIMALKRKFVYGEQRKNVNTFIILLALSGIVGIVTNFFLPMNDVAVNSALGLEAGGVLMLFVASIVRKKG